MRPATRPEPSLRPFLSWALALLLLATALAGCMDSDDEDDDSGDGGVPGGSPPPGTGGPGDTPLSASFRLVANTTGWANEDNLTFDAREHTVENGNVTAWVFDLGDGTNRTITPPAAPVLNHTYDVGGVYVANITLHAEGGPGGNQSVQVAERVLVTVHERHSIPEGELESMVLLGEGDSRQDTFTVRRDADTFEVILEIENTATGLLAGSADGSVRVLDPDGELLAEEDFEIDADANATITLNETLSMEGDHMVEVELVSGEISFSGVASVRYAEPLIG